MRWSSSKRVSVALTAVVASLALLGASACSSGDDSRTDAAGGAAAGGPSAVAGPNPNNATFLTRAIPDASHADVTETCPDGMRDGKRCIPDRVLARPAVCYSGYRTGESPSLSRYPTEDEVKEDLELLVHAGYSFIRLFDSSQHAQTVLKVITDNGFDIKLQLGIWIAGSKSKADAQNQLQISQGIALATQYSSIVVGVSVGNETLDTWSSVLTDPADLADYIMQVKAGVTQPVATDDLYPPFELGPGYENVSAVFQVVDYLSVHVYAAIDASFGSWGYEELGFPAGPARAQAMMQDALIYTKSSLKLVQEALALSNVSIPITIGEAGWKSRVTDPTHLAEPAFSHEVNQQMFFDSLEDWAYGAGRDASSPATAFYFEAFDEPWKTTDDGWGLFDTNRNAKYVMWSKFPELTQPGAPAYTGADAIYYQAP
jgi:exo-beta-1,3-glucanase (GH17 family)